MKLPVEESKVAPSWVQLSQDIVTMSGGASGSVVLSMKVSLEPTVTVWGPGTTREGGLLAFNLMDAFVLEKRRPSEALNSTE